MTSAATWWARLPDRAVAVLAAADPVAAFLAAHDAGLQVSLATSGTSGTSRTVVRTSASWVDSFDHVSRLAGVGPDSRVWVPGPVTATMNLFAAVHARACNLRLVIDRRDASHAHLTPTRLARLLDEGAALAGLTVVVAGDRLAGGLHDRARAAGAVVHHYYGAAELSFVAWGPHAEELRPFPDVDVSVRSGEIWVRSPYLCTGYDGTAGPWRRAPDGFATVGDRGTCDAGRLRVAGRPGTVTVAGATVEVAEVEATLREAAAGDLVVLGVPRATVGTVLAVVLTTVEDLAPVRARARTALAGGHRPRLWFHLPTLPATGSGKVNRAALTDLLVAPDPAHRPVGLPLAGTAPPVGTSR
ncbi:MAG: AMP-binding protein [Nocardioidaceae bacterium]